MRDTYSPQEVEAEVQARWVKDEVYRAKEHALDKNGKEKPKYYVCSMLPYPSGKLHSKRRSLPLSPHEGLQRDDPHGLGLVRAPRGKCRLK